MIRCTLLVAALAAASTPLTAQDMRLVAEDALNGLGPVTDQLTTPNMRDAVVPYAGTNVDEAEMTPGDFDRAIIDIRAGGDPDGRAYQSTLDSLEERPRVELGTDPLAIADDAVENAEAALSGLFSADGGTCEAMFQNGSYAGERFCKAILQRDIWVCEVWREISVDREDFWACEIAERDFTRVCNPTISWACTGATGPACRRNRVRANRPFTWANNDREMQFSLGSTTDPTVCVVQQERIIVNAYVGFDFSRFDANYWRFRGVAQLRVNNEAIWTYGTSSRGPLNIQYDDVGGKDGADGLVPVVYAGRTRIDYCTTSDWRTMPGPRSLMSAFDTPVPGPSRINSQLQPYIPMGEHEEIVIDLVYAYPGRIRQDFRLDVRGQCCSRISAVGGETC